MSGVEGIYNLVAWETRFYSNQKEIECISVSNITAAVETHPLQLHNLLYISPSLTSLTFYGPPPRAS